jgi:hypothetical protein
MAARRGHRGDPGGEHAHGLGHGVAGAAVAAWPAVALVGSYELLMIIRGVQVPADVTTGAWLSGRLPDADPLQMQAEDLFADDLAAGRVPSVRVIRTRLHVGQSRAQRAQAYLASLAPHSRLERRSNVHRHVGVRERQDRPSRHMQCQRRSHAKDPLRVQPQFRSHRQGAQPGEGAGGRLRYRLVSSRQNGISKPLRCNYVFN